MTKACPSCGKWITPAEMCPFCDIELVKIDPQTGEFLEDTDD